MEKLYDRIDFANGTTPALNQTNLNAMSKGIDDIDDRVIQIANMMESATDDYEDLTNKPKINNVELSGNKTSADLSVTSTTVADKDHLNVGMGNTINTQGAAYYPVGVVGQYNQLSQNAKNSFVSGMSNNVTGDTSIVAGNGNKSSGSYSAVFGLSNEATGSYSAVLGNSNKTSASCANAIGYGLKNSNASSVVVGKYNTDKTGVIFGVGNGSSNSERHNALEITTANKIVLGLPTESEYPIKGSSIEDTSGNKLSEVASDVTKLNDDIVDLNSSITTINSSITTINSNLATQSNINNQQSRDIKNLYEMAKGNLYTEQTDDTVARVKTIPSGACTYGTIDVLGGMSRKGKNFWNYGDITLNSASGIVWNLPSGTYTFSCNMSSPNLTLRLIYGETSELVTITSSPKTFTISSNVTGFNFSNPNNYNITNIQVEIGSSSTSYEPYTENLIDAKVDKVVSVGKNLANKDTFSENKWIADFEGTIANANGYNVSDFIEVVGGTNYTCGDRGSARCLWYDENKNSIGNTWGNPLVAPNNAKYIRFTVTNAYLDTFYFGINMTSYSPYFEIEKTIPQSIKSLDGYGIGINSTCYNYIDFDRKVFVKKVGSVDLGTLGWFSHNEERTLAYKIDDMTTVSSTSTVPNLLCKKLDTVTYSTLVGGTVDNVISQANAGYIGVHSSTITSTSDATTKLSGITLFYELATPTETDISSMLDTDADILTVEENGTLSFHYPSLDNGYSVDMPSTENYLIKL